MDRRIGFLIFFTIFIAIYFGMHLYIFVRMSQFFKVKRNIYFYIAIIILSSLFILANVLQHYSYGLFAKWFYTTTSILFGAIFLLFVAVLLHHILSIFSKMDPFYSGASILGVVFLLVLFGIVNALSFDVKEVTVPMKNLPNKVRVAQISDIHLGPILDERYLKKIVDKVNGLKPDIVFITGDLADGPGKFDEETIRPLNDLNAKTYFVTGNHDDMFGADQITSLLQKTPVEVLRNNVTTSNSIQIIGIDNPSEFNSVPLRESLRKIPIDNDKPSILLYHPPQGFEDAAEYGIGLQLSGHLHAGQIKPFNLLSRIFFKRVQGLFHYKETYLYVSPGTGTWGPPMRLGSRNEITLITLIPKTTA